MKVLRRIFRSDPLGSDKSKFFLFGYSAAKKGAANNEDAHYPKNSVEVEKRAVMAVADGASGGIFSGEWAEALVDATVAECGPANVQDLKEDIFAQKIKEICRAYQPVIDTANLFIKNKFAHVGSQATFLWAQVEAHTQSPHLVWAIAVGDSCLLKVNVKTWEITGSFPLTKVEDFGSSPDLISNKSQNALRFKQTLWNLEKGEILIMASDAMAKWMLEMNAGGQGRTVGTKLLSFLESREAFEKFVVDQREAKEYPLWNDDTTLVGCISLSLYQKLRRAEIERFSLDEDGK